MSAVGLQKPGDHSWNRHRTPAVFAEGGLGGFVGGPVPVAGPSWATQGEHLRCRRRRRELTIVQGGEFVFRHAVVQQESPASETGSLGLDDGKGERGGRCGVHGVPPPPQDLGAYPGCIRMRRHDEQPWSATNDLSNDDGGLLCWRRFRATAGGRDTPTRSARKTTRADGALSRFTCSIRDLTDGGQRRQRQKGWSGGPPGENDDGSTPRPPLGPPVQQLEPID